MRMRNLLSLPVLVGLFAAGCILDVSTRSVYDGCLVGDTCSGLSICQTVGITGVNGNLCTYNCNPAAAATSCGLNAICIGTGGGNGQCFRLCTTVACDATSGTVCARIALNDGSGLQTQACVPGTTFGGGTVTPVTTVSAYNKCDPGNPTLRCAAGLTCQMSAVASRGIGFTCTQACTDASQCPGANGFAACVNGFCAAICSNPNAFDARCSMFGTACVAATNQAGQPVSFCAP